MAICGDIFPTEEQYDLVKLLLINDFFEVLKSF